MDLFYYGSQDIPPPLGASGHRRGESEGGVCEACNAPVTPEELAEGKASEIYGVVLCAACGGEDEAPLENRVELYFCDRCHVSVPVYRVDTGEALSGDGRILCLDCRAGPHRRSVSRHLVVATVALLLIGAGLVFATGFGGTPGARRVRAQCPRLVARRETAAVEACDRPRPLRLHHARNNRGTG